MSPVVDDQKQLTANSSAVHTCRRRSAVNASVLEFACDDPYLAVDRLGGYRGRHQRGAGEGEQHPERHDQTAANPGPALPCFAVAAGSR